MISDTNKNISLKQAYETFLSKEMYDKALACLREWYKVCPKEAISTIREFRAILNSNPTFNTKNVLLSAYDLTAKDYFDDFMIALEWNRELSAKYWLPRRSKLMVACQALQDMEDGKLDELFLSMPPRVGKTTLILFFILWIILKDSERSNLYCSYTDSVVGVFYNGLMEILKDEVTYRWKEIFPHSEIATTNAKDFLLNMDRRKRYASLTARSLYGTLNGACDCNGYIIGDDLISGIEEAMNKDRLNSAWLKVDNNLLPRAKQGARKLWIGTRWSMVDPIARRIDLLENDARFSSVRYKIINFPALNEKDESNFEYACDVGFDTDYFKQRRASFERNNDMASWLAQYQGTPVERVGTVFEPGDMRYYNGELPHGIEPDRIFMAIDPAWGGGDYCSAPIVYQYENDMYVSDVVFDNKDKRVTIPKIVKKAMENKVSVIYIEATKTTSAFSEEVDEELRKNGYRCNVQSTIKAWTGTGKAQRIFDKAPEIRESFVFRQVGNWTKEYELFMNNIFSFSYGKNKNDDSVDSLVIGLIMATNSSYKAIIKNRRMF